MDEKAGFLASRAAIAAHTHPRKLGGIGVAHGALRIADAPSGRHGVAIMRARFAWCILLTALALTVLEGAVRKWVIGSAFQAGSYLAYFSKDIVFTLLLLLRAREDSSVPLGVFRRWLIPGCFLLVCGAVASAYHEINLTGAALTLRAVLFLPVVASAVATRVQGISLRSVAAIIGLLTILNFPLGVLQNHLPRGHVLNRYATDTLDITTTASGVRATGTFSYITGMSIISVVGIWAGMVYMSLAQNVWQQVFGWAVLASGAGCGLASVSRGPILIAAWMVLPWLLFSGEWASGKSRGVMAGILLLGALVLFDLTTTFFELGQGLLLRAESSSDTKERSLGQYDEALMALDMAPLGNGLGTEQVGRYHYSQGEMAGTTFESQLPRLVLETGVFGLAGFLVICAGALLALQAAKRYTVTGGEKAALLATQLLLLALFAGNVVFNHTASAFAWMIFAAAMASLLNLRGPSLPRA